MNLDDLVTQDKSESGEWFPVELYGKTQDFDLLILGDDSNTVTKHTRERVKKLSEISAKEKNEKNEKNEGLRIETLDTMTKMNDEAVLIRIAGIRGWKREYDEDGKVLNETEDPVTINGKELKNDKESYKLLITKIPDIKEFVLNKARDRTNFLSEPSRN